MKRSSSQVPYGYKVDPSNAKNLLPIAKERAALKQIVPMIHERVLSLREGALYLESLTGRRLSHAGLAKIALKTKKTKAE